LSTALLHLQITLVLAIQQDLFRKSQLQVRQQLFPFVHTKHMVTHEQTNLNLDDNRVFDV